MHDDDDDDDNNNNNNNNNCYCGLPVTFVDARRQHNIMIDAESRNNKDIWIDRREIRISNFIITFVQHQEAVHRTPSNRIRMK